MPESAPVAAINPSASVLLIMDYQNGILEMVSSDELVPIARNLIRTFRDHGGHIGYVRVGFAEGDLDNVPSTSGMAGNVTPERRALFAADHPATQIHDDLAPQEGDIVVRKQRISAFSTTDLHEQLGARGISTLVLAGISTSGVVHSTVLDAFDRDYRVVVLQDACADPDQEVHDFLMKRVFAKRGDVITVRELHGLLH